MKKLFIIFFLISSQLFACTAILVTKKASSDGSIFVCQSADDEFHDQRIVYIPAKNHKKNSKKAIYKFVLDYPRYAGDLAKAYDLKNYPKSEPAGFIDEVDHTYAYFDGVYGMINEHQVAIGESTCASYFLFDSSEDRIFDIRALSEIALERCKTAKDAVLLMGKLADEYGYYGWGETLVVGDTKEGYAFEISPTPTGKGALWVAKKIPDGEIYVCPNIFRIREVDQNDKNIFFSKHLFKIAKEHKWIKEDQTKLDWLKTISPGEYNHPYYSLRRVWRLFSKIAPSKNFSPWVKDAFTFEYPFSIKPDKKLSLQDVFALYRDHYENTQFDLTKGIAAGAFGNPARYFGDYDTLYNKTGYDPVKLSGAWERAISVYYCGFTFVNQLRDYMPNDLGVSWVGFDRPYTTCFIPFYIGVNDLPDSISYQTVDKFDDTQIFPVFNLASNYAELKFDFIKKDIIKKQIELENYEFENQNNIEKKAIKLLKKNKSLAKKYLTDFCNKNAKLIHDNWYDLTKMIIYKYADGYINIPKAGEMIGYPKWYREKVGYQNGPKSYEKESYEKKQD